MAITRKSFKGSQVEERASTSGSEILGPWQQDSDYKKTGQNMSAQDLIVNMTGAKAMQSGVSKGCDDGMSGPGNDAAPARHNYSVPGADGVVGQKSIINDASTGTAGALPASVKGTAGPTETGAGRGSKIIKQYGGPPGYGQPPGNGSPSNLVVPGGNLGRNTAK